MLGLKGILPISYMPLSPVWFKKWMILLKTASLCGTKILCKYSILCNWLTEKYAKTCSLS